MSFCEHCEGQRFDRARVLRVLRQACREARTSRKSEIRAALLAAVKTIRALDVPHLEFEPESDVVH